MSAIFSSKTAEHNTPPAIIDAIRDVFGGTIGIDPATNETAQTYIQAETYYTRESNPRTLAQQWRAASLWLNPPFTEDSGRINPTTGKMIRTRVIGLWVEKWYDTLINRHVDQAALLVPARTDTEWFQPLFGFPMCFVSGRLHFSDADNGATFPTVIVYGGHKWAQFYERFGAFGYCGKISR